MGLHLVRKKDLFPPKSERFWFPQRTHICRMSIFILLSGCREFTRPLCASLTTVIMPPPNVSSTNLLISEFVKLNSNKTNTEAATSPPIYHSPHPHQGDQNAPKERVCVGGDLEKGKNEVNLLHSAMYCLQQPEGNEKRMDRETIENGEKLEGELRMDWEWIENWLRWDKNWIENRLK